MNRLQFASTRKCITAAFTTLAALASFVALSALPATNPGSLDPTFGAAGKTVVTAPTQFDYGGRILVQADGKYLVSGFGQALSHAAFGHIDRFNRDGSLDTTFFGTGRRIFGDSVFTARIGDIRQQADGKIVAVGSQSRFDETGFERGWVTRLNTDGSTDTGFGNGGFTFFDNATRGIILSTLVVESDGKLLVAGYESVANTDLHRPFTLRLLANGLPDATRGQGGFVLFGDDNLRLSPFSMLLDAGGKPVIAGGIWLPGGPDQGHIVRLNADGSLDPAFGSGGRFAYAVPNSDIRFEGMAIDAQGRIAAAGYTSASPKIGVVVRVTANGVPDQEFGLQGIVTLPEPLTSAEGLALQSDGKLVVTSGIVDGNAYLARIVRLLPNGTLDVGFGAAGVSSGFGYEREFARAVALDVDGQIVVAGIAYTDADHTLIARVMAAEITTPVVEFYNGSLNHYFITADPAEASAIDNGAAGPGWTRTGQTFKSGGPNRVCRFYGSPETNPATGMRRGPNSHFYTIEAAECGAVKTDAGWKFESYDFNGWPLVGSGAQAACPQGTQAIRRVYNQRFAQNDSNHRYITTDALYQQMMAQGWAGEGTVFCAAL